MSFHWPQLLWLLLVPVALLGWDLTRRRRAAAAPAHPKITRAEASHGALAIGPQASQRGPRVRWRLALGLVLAALALARPQWGRLEEPVFDQAREILIAVDLSRSMLAQDVKPSRLDRAKLLITSLLERVAGERVGLIVFSGTAFLQSPLSADYEILREFLPALGPDYLPEGGSNYSALLKAAREAFSATGAADRFLIILSDGEATDDDWQREFDALVKQGVRVLGLGIGTEQGAMIPDSAGGFVKDERGAVVLSRLGSTTLRQLAEKTGGVYTDASAWVDLAQLVQSTVERGQKGDFKETNRVRLAERFQWALAPAVLLLLWSFWSEFPVQPRSRDLKLAASAAPHRAPQSSTAGAATALAVSLLSWVIAYGSLVIAATPPPSDPLAAPLSKLVGQLASRDTLSARDYAELARTTTTYGQRVQSGGQPVPEGPVRDALKAVDAGAAADAKAADWPKLRSELEALLKKNEEQSDQSEQDKNEPRAQTGKDGKDQQPNTQNPEGGDSAEKPPSDPQSSDQQKEQKDQTQRDPAQPGDPSQENAGEQKSGEEQPKKDAQSAFGDMENKQPEQPPQPQSAPGDVQKVGGAPEKKETGAAQMDPALAIPLQKLDQLKNQDSPARLYQLMQDPKEKPAKPRRDW
ncbi:MAG TPA: VWA domain-containing protein [Opitutaceae bacterium]